MKFSQVSVSKNDQKAQTPDWMLHWVKETFGNYFDPCPAGPKFDGLKIPWKKLNYVNPPYDDIASWLDKAVYECKTNNSVSVFFIPFRLHTKYIQRNLNFIKCSIILNKCVAFKGYSDRLPHALHVCVVGPRSYRLPRCMKGVKKQVSGHIVPVTNMKSLVAQSTPFCNDISVLKGKVSEPLSAILKQKTLTKSSSFGVVCPARLDNRVLYDEGFIKCSTMLFGNQPLKSTQGKFIGGTCVLLFGASVPRSHNSVQLYSMDVNKIIK